MPTNPTVVLVHGAFADASGYAGIIRILQSRDIEVRAPWNPFVAWLLTRMRSAVMCRALTAQLCLLVTLTEAPSFLKRHLGCPM